MNECDTILLMGGFRMENKILFVNKRANLTDEFIAAMEETDFTISTAKNGLEAIEKLKEQQYKVVITGLIMDEVDGNQLIAHINKEYPSTACVVLTTRMNIGQLAYLVNQLEVYRIYLRPVDLRGLFLEMLKDAVIYYDHHLQYTQEQLIMKSSKGQNSQKLDRAQLLLNGMKDANKQVELFMNGILEFSMKEAEEYEENIKLKLLSFEKRLVRQYLEVGNSKWTLLDVVQEEIEKMISKEERAKTKIDLPLGIEYAENLCQNLYFAIWLLHLKISSILKDYEIEIKGHNLGAEKLIIRMDVKLQMDQWKKLEASVVGKQMIKIMDCFLERMTHDFLEEERENHLVFSFQLFRS